MEKLIIGIDLCDNYTQAAVLGREDAWMLPTVICRKKSAEEWYHRGRCQRSVSPFICPHYARRNSFFAI